MELPFFLNMSHSLSDGIETTELKYQNMMLFFTSDEMISSYVFVSVLTIIYILARRSFKRQEVEANLENKDKDSEVNKFKIKRVLLRNIYLGLLIVGLILIWKDEIKTAFFSISFAVMAIAVLWKEVISNMISSIIISVSRIYSIGDVVEVKGKQGVVIDKSLFNTKILLKQDGLPTTQEHIIPNSFFITNEASLVTRFGHYTTHFVDVHVDRKSELLPTSKLLKQVADECVKDRAEKMAGWRRKIKEREGVEVPSHKPFVSIVPADKAYLTLKFTCDNRAAFLLRNEILEKYYALLPMTLHEYNLNVQKEIEKAFGEQKEEPIYKEPPLEED